MPALGSSLLSNSSSAPGEEQGPARVALAWASGPAIWGFSLWVGLEPSVLPDLNLGRNGPWKGSGAS